MKKTLKDSIKALKDSKKALKDSKKALKDSKKALKDSITCFAHGEACGDAVVPVLGYEKDSIRVRKRH
jgi:hypothetical protein